MRLFNVYFIIGKTVFHIFFCLTFSQNFLFLFILSLSQLSSLIVLPSFLLFNRYHSIVRHSVMHAVRWCSSYLDLLSRRIVRPKKYEYFVICHCAVLYEFLSLCLKLSSKASLSIAILRGMNCMTIHPCDQKATT